jgi:conjugal transfer pilus assembly protein TraB
MIKMINKIIDKYKAMSPASKRVAKGLLIIVLLLILYTIFEYVTSEEIVIDKPEEQLVTQELVNATDKELSESLVIDRRLQAMEDRLTVEIESLKEENEALRSVLQGVEGLTDEELAATPNIPGYEHYPPSPPVPGSQPQNQTPITQPPTPAIPAPPVPSTVPPVNNNPPQPEPQRNTRTVGGVKRISAEPISQEVPAETASGRSNYFPTTTLMKGVLLNGLYAPTLSKGQGSPHPAIIRLDDYSWLPNELQRSIEGCRLLGEAYGELSDSRVHIRLIKLACTTKDGTAFIDDAVQGIVFGEDGIIGVPGETLANFNRLLMTSFFMESLAGLGNAIRGMATTTVISSDGTAQEYIEGDGTDKAGKIMLTAGGEGLGKGFEMMSEFYLNILNEMSPVIKVNGGRDIEIALTEGIELQLKGNSWTWEELL